MKLSFNRIIAFISILAVTFFGCGQPEKVTKSRIEAWENKLYEDLNFERRVAEINGLERDELLDSVAADLAKIALLRDITDDDFIDALDAHSAPLMEAVQIGVYFNTPIEKLGDLPKAASEVLIDEDTIVLMSSDFELIGLAIETDAQSATLEYVLAFFADTTSTGEVRPTLTGNLWPNDSLEPFENRLRDFVNSERRALGMNILHDDLQLRGLARAYAQKMLIDGFFGHHEPSGKGLLERIKGSNMDNYSYWGENLASLYNPVDASAEAHEGLMNSPSHKANIINSTYTHIGVGAATDGKWWIFVQLFGKRRNI
ncbi:hypothetical protein DRQ36_07900 [bacterium]|nr:MAG: hypothetical protein DRQ36_07900 [bacterium]